MAADESSSPTRDRLLDAAEGLLAARGVHGTGMQDIRREAGVSHGSLYHAFPGGKEEIVASSIERSGRSIAENLRLLFEAAPFAEALHAAFIVVATYLTETEFTQGCRVGTPASDGHGVASIRIEAAQAFELVVQQITTAAEQIGIPENDGAALAINLVSLYQGAILVSVSLQSAEPMHQAAELAKAMAERAVLAAEPCS